MTVNRGYHLCASPVIHSTPLIQDLNLRQDFKNNFQVLKYWNALVIIDYNKTKRKDLLVRKLYLNVNISPRSIMFTNSALFFGNVKRYLCVSKAGTTHACKSTICGEIRAPP